MLTKLHNSVLEYGRKIKYGAKNNDQLKN